MTDVLIDSGSIRDKINNYQYALAHTQKGKLCQLSPPTTNNSSRSMTLPLSCRVQPFTSQLMMGNFVERKAPKKKAPFPSSKRTESNELEEKVVFFLFTSLGSKKGINKRKERKKKKMR